MLRERGRRVGLNAGMYERATAPELVSYNDQVMRQVLLPVGARTPFAVDDRVRCVPVNALVHAEELAARYVIVGAGKTAHDAIICLLQSGLLPERIRWIKPREAWFLNRDFRQGGDLVGRLIEGLARQVEAVAGATSLEDLFARVDRCPSGRLLRPLRRRGP